MKTLSKSTPEQEARAATERVLDLVFRNGAPIVVVNSPPGAGKTWLVESAVAVGVQHLDFKVAVATPRSEQAYDLLRRLARGFTGLQIQHLGSSGRDVPDDIAGDRRLRPTAYKPRDLVPGAGVVVATVAKLAMSVHDFHENEFDLLICDEAYQTSFKEFSPLFHTARQVLLVGDPGQLPPLVRVDVARFEGARVKVHWPTPLEIDRKFPGVPVVGLPVTRRLPQDTVEMLQPAFYPNLPFVSAVRDEQRSVRFGAAGMRTGVDRALDAIEAGATIVGVLLPPKDFPLGELDEEVSETMAGLASRIVARGARIPEVGEVQSGNIGCADPHVASNAYLARQLRRLGLGRDLVCETPEQWQGLERSIMIVKHPLSGQQRPDAFALDPGRLCVMLSRHRSACIIVGREGIGRALERYEHDSAVRAMQAADAVWKGWSVNAQLWRGLERADRLVLSAAARP